MLKNGIQVRNHKRKEVIHILCDAEMLTAIRLLFARVCPEAVDRMKEIPEY